jgi:YbbR domain-containing protein
MNSAARHKTDNVYMKQINFLRDSLTRNFGTKIIFLIVAIVLWLSINLEKDFETIIDIPVVINNIHKGKTLSAPVPSSAKIKIRSKGKNLIIKDIDKDVFISVDATNVIDSAIFRITADFFVNVSGLQLEPLFIYSPQEVEIKLDDYSQKKIPVKLNFQYSIAPGYVKTGAFTIRPDSVTISGPASIVRRTTYAETKKITESELKADYSEDFELISVSPKLVKYSEKIVSVNQKIVRKGSNSFKVPVSVLNKPDNVNLLIEPIAIDILVTGPVNELHEIGSDDFSVTADYSEFDPQTGRMKLNVTSAISHEWVYDTNEIRVVPY